MRVRDESMSAQAQCSGNSRIELVDVIGRRCIRAPAQFGRDESEGADAESERPLLEQLLLADELVQPARKLDVVANHAAITAGARLLESKPDLERAEPARILGAVLEVVLHFLAFVVV